MADHCDEYISAEQARVHLPSKPCLSVVLRWMQKGAPVRYDGLRCLLPLESRIDGVRRVTTLRWVNEFQEERCAIDRYENGRRPKEGDQQFLNRAVPKLTLAPDKPVKKPTKKPKKK